MQLPPSTSAPRPGRLFWITGLSGAGKTTIAHALHERLVAAGAECVLLDGDRTRELFGGDLGHAPEDRRRAAWRNARMAAALAAAGFDVICATISMIEAVRAWLRAEAPGYLEVYLRVPDEVRAARDPKGLYAAGDGRAMSLVGRDQRCELPTRPDLVIDNHGEVLPERAVNDVLALAPAAGIQAAVPHSMKSL